MNTLIYRILFITFCMISQCIHGQYEISGKLANYDSIWQNKLYLSYIEPNEKFSDISHNQVINSTTLDEQGNFILKGNNLLDSNSIIRISLENDKSHILFSGGFQKNYLILIANNKSKIHINAKDFSKDPLNYETSGDFFKQNEKIKEFQLLITNKTKSDSYYNSEKSTKILLDNKTRKIRDFCELNNYPLVNIIALQHLDLDKDYPNNHLFYEKLLKKLNLNNKSSSSYIEALQKEIDVINYKYELYKNPSNSIYYLIILLLAIIILSLIIYIVYLRKKEFNHVLNSFKEKDSPKDLVKQLTKREKQILGFVIKEYQNKEIAKELHLEVSTIKTHLSKIYQKLQIKNRSQVKQLFFDVINQD